MVLLNWKFPCFLISIVFLLFLEAETWPFLVKLLMNCITLEISASKRRLPKASIAKTLRAAIQRAEDAKFSG